MKHSPSAILSRIECCRLQRKEAVTWEQEDAWQAEEAGLIDAMLGRDRTETRKTYEPSLLARYELGLRDGQTLMRLLELKRGKQPRWANARVVGRTRPSPVLALADSA